MTGPDRSGLADPAGSESADPDGSEPAGRGSRPPTSADRRRRRTARIRRAVQIGALVVAAFSVLTAVLILLAAFVNDQRIDQDMGSATATVTEVTDSRAAVEFDAGGGVHVRPEAGVFYPTGLVDGQRVQVEFRRANPDLVRVSGRSWTVAVLPTLSVPAVAVPAAALVYYLAIPRANRPSPRVRRTVPQ